MADSLLTKLGLRRMALISLALESVRWPLQGPFPELRHPAAPGVPGWIRFYYLVQMIFFAAASLAAGGQVIDAARTRNWKQLDFAGMILYLVWWVEVSLARG